MSVVDPLHSRVSGFVSENRRRGLLSLGIAAVCLFGSTTVRAEKPGARAADEAAIRAASKAYVAALAKGDAELLAGAWTPDGDIVDAAGNVLPGRQAMALEKTAATGERPEIRIHENTLRFLAADVAIEDGLVEIVPGSGAPLNGRFSATWVRQDGKWKLAALREARGELVTGPAALADLEWMVGEWKVVDEHPAANKGEGEPVIEVSTKWNESKTFLNRVMTITHSPDAPPLRITQRIGWDPLSRSIRSWAFGSDGSFGEASWAPDGRSWVAEARAVMPDGRQTSSLNIYSYDGKDRCAWRSMPTHIGGEHVPRVDLMMVRKPEAAGR